MNTNNLREPILVEGHKEQELKKDNNFIFDKVERADQNISQNMNFSYIKGRLNDNSVEIDSRFRLDTDCLFDNERNNTIDSIS